MIALRTSLVLTTSSALRLSNGAQTVIIDAEQLDGVWLIRLRDFDTVLHLGRNSGKPCWSIAAPESTRVERVA